MGPDLKTFSKNDDLLRTSTLFILFVNIGKTEAMGCRIKKAEVSEEVENAMKERISVKVEGVECGDG